MQIPLPIIAAITGALVAGSFGLLTFILVLLNEKRKRREEAGLRHLQRQIEELYGPLHGLNQFLAAVNVIEWQRVPPDRRDKNGRTIDDEGGRVIRFFTEHYYLPLNEQRMELIRTKVYLLDSDTIPKSFMDFIEHAAQLDCFHKLWKEFGIKTSRVPPIAYPAEFSSDVESTLNDLRREYNEYIRRMKEGRRLKSLLAPRGPN